ncbi:Ku protein [Thermoflavimicrobium daqui]|uniref:Non-homologous end joining protein Ku n=1 Tax=Thermoflavimicrobium daqui TaxID=2137476 RepID=A0A364K0R6_9BACL|nr:Ku protein [Thermoflavimicrobium daqui]RAL21096.1 Ku protein [Thermoflavimicrobium daqui]
MHTMWKGSISFGLVNIPIKMYAATEEKDIRFRYLHKECRTPVKNVRMCPHCNKEVPWEEVVKGFEYADGRFVILEKEEMAELLPDPNKAIEILDFVELTEIDPIYFNKTYYLGAQDANNKAYALLRKALDSSQKIGVAKVTIRSKQSLAVIRVYQNCLVMETIFYPDEVRDVKMVPGVPEEIELPEKELKMADQLIENLTIPFDPEKYQDEYRKSLEEALEKKINAEEIVEAPEKKPEKVIDLMAALQASLEATTTKKKNKRAPRKKKEKVTS